MNILDILILFFLVGFSLSGLRRGFLITLIEMMGIIISIAVPLLLYIPAGEILVNQGIPRVYSGVLAFITIWAVTLMVYYGLTKSLYYRVSEELLRSNVNKIFGLLPGLGKGLIFTTFILAVLVIMPVPFFSTDMVEESIMGDPLLDKAAEGAAVVSDIFGEPLQHALGFLTIEWQADETTELNYTVSDPEIASTAEEEMLEMVNQERVERGLSELVMDEALRETARAHSTDMFQRGYFGHLDPDGVTPFDRIRAGGSSFNYAGENLAAAPTVSIAHRGLMNSPQHKENLLRPEFRRVGIGAMKSDRHGIMFTQKFTD